MVIPRKAEPFVPAIRRVAVTRWSDRAAQLWAESGWNPHARSAVGAMGLGQFMPGTWRGGQQQGWIPAGASPDNPEDAIAAQHAYMNQLEGMSRAWLGPCPKDGGWWDAGLGSYNAGPGSIRKAIKLADSLSYPGHDAWKKTLPAITKHHSKETLDYIPRIYGFRARLESGQ